MAGLESLVFLPDPQRVLPWLAVALALQTLVVLALLAETSRARRAQRAAAARLRFESLAVELSARLIPVSLSDLDAEIERGLDRIARLLGMDRAGLGQHVSGALTMAVATAAAPLPDADRFPWTAERLQRGDVVQFSSLDELPRAAARDRQGFESAGTRSYLAVPLRTGRSNAGVMVFDALHDGRTCPDELVDRVRLVGEAFAGALERERLERVMTERLGFEALLSEQSAAFSSLPVTEVDRAITGALRRITDFFSADWGSLAEFSQDTRAARITHSWVAEGAAARPTTVTAAETPWVTARLHRGEVVRFSRVSELPADAAAIDRNTYLKLGIRSHIEVPLKRGGAVLGALTFSTLGAEREWADELVQRLQLLGEVFANVLSRRHWELEAQRLRRELGHVGRVSTVGELTVSLAHQLNQPLAAILSNAQTAQDALDSSAVDLREIREILADIVEDDKRAGQVIARLRALLKNGDPEYTDLDINELVSEVARFVSADAALRNVGIRLDLAPGLPVVQGDRVQLQQVVLNLVLNGLDAIRDGATGAHTLDLWTLAEPPSAVRVGVRDSGSGIDEVDLEQVFEAFYTTKPDGLGMGLAIARSIVEAHGGRLTARNNPEGGATLSFTLPVGGPAR